MLSDRIHNRMRSFIKLSHHRPYFHYHFLFRHYHVSRSLEFMLMHDNSLALVENHN